MKIKLILLFLLSSILGYSQNFDTIFGKVITEKGSGVAFANIIEINNRYGAASDSNGKFKLLLKSSSSLSDKLKISALGFNDTIISFIALKANNKVILKEKPIVLQEIVINQSKKRKTQILGAKTQSVIDNGYNGLYPGIQWGLYIKNRFNKPVQIKKVEFYITKYGKPNTPVRLRIYNFDTNTNLQGTDLLTKSFINNSKNGGEWLVFDLEKENVYLPKNGALVALEWLNCGDEYYYYSSKDSKYQYYGVVLGMTRDIKSNLGYIKSFEKKWHKIEGFPEIINPAIRVICIP